jgi:hypothetical protein
MTIEFAHGDHDAILEPPFGRDTNVAQHRAGWDPLWPRLVTACENTPLLEAFTSKSSK